MGGVFINGLFATYLLKTALETGMLKGTAEKGTELGMFIGRLLFVLNIIVCRENKIELTVI